MPDRPPNVLFLMSDEHRGDVAGFAGNDTVRTPTLDWLAETGVVFENAYTPSPVCIPARQCLMAGQLPRTCGCRTYGEDLPPFSTTFAKRFAQHAYTTACFGKLHHLGADQMQGWTHRPAGDLEVAADAIEGADTDAFEQYEAPPGTGGWGNQKEIERAVATEGPYMRFDRRARDAAVDFVRDHFVAPEYDRPGDHRPTLLKASFLQPHYPYFTDSERFAYYLDRVPVYHGESRFDHPILSYSQGERDNPVDVSERDARRATAAYYGRIETVDEYFQDVIESLRSAGENLDEWIIVYCSDHGEMLGEHGIWEKMRFFEASSRVPLIVRWPERFDPGTVEANVNLCDLYATLCDLAGIPLPEPEDTVNGAGLDSRSLVSLLKGDAERWHDRHDNETISQYGDHLMIKQGNLKYSWCPDAPEVLFDLDADPGETRNHIDDAEYADAVATFRERRDALGFGPNADANYRNAGYTTTRTDSR
jgi:choline-sulfatase